MPIYPPEPTPPESLSASGVPQQTGNTQMLFHLDSDEYPSYNNFLDIRSKIMQELKSEKM